jgi:hypothetical protein
MVTVEAVRVGCQHPKVPIPHVGALQIRRRGQNAHPGDHDV